MGRKMKPFLSRFPFVPRIVVYFLINEICDFKCTDVYLLKKKRCFMGRKMNGPLLELIVVV